MGTLQAIASILNYSVAVASHDAGNHALSEMLKDEGEIRVGTIDYLANEETAAAILRNQATAHTILIDTGANSSNELYNSIDFGRALAEECARFGRRFIAVVPTSSSKAAGLVTAIETIERMKQVGIQAHLLLNDSNGAQDFTRDGRLPNISHSIMPPLQPGFQAIRSEFRISLQSLIANPPDGYKLAANHFSDWLTDFSQTPIVREIFGLPAAGVRRLRPPAQKLSHFVDTKYAASDVKLMQNYAAAQAAMRLLDRSLPRSEFEDAAEAYRTAYWEYNEC